MGRYTLKQQLNREKNRKMKIVIFLFLSIFIFLSYNFFFGKMGYLKYVELKKNEKKLITEIREISQQNISLKKEIDLLKKDQQYLEKYAREKFGLVKPGEMVFQFENKEK